MYYCYSESKYVDNILILRNIIKEVKNLFNNFEMKNLRTADVILNIKLLREDSSEIIFLQFYCFISHILLSFRFKRNNPTSGARTLVHPSVYIVLSPIGSISRY